MNLLLISLDFPPVIIKKGLEEQQYKQYLADIQAYGGSPDLFYKLMAALLIRSQELVLRAIDGEEIDEEEDWKKELRLIKQNLGENEIKIQKNSNIIGDILETFFVSFLNKKKEDLLELEKLFFESKFLIDGVDFDSTLFDRINFRTFVQNKDSVSFHYSLSGYKSKNLKLIEIDVSINFKFKEFVYIISISNSLEILQKLYHDPITEGDMIQIVNEVGKELISQIKSKVREL